jgi:hypothetical protein
VEKEVIVEKVVTREVEVREITTTRAPGCGGTCAGCVELLSPPRSSAPLTPPCRQVPVEIKVPVPVEKIIERTVVQEVEVIREVPVPVEKIVERVVTKEVRSCQSCELSCPDGIVYYCRTYYKAVRGR